MPGLLASSQDFDVVDFEFCTLKRAQRGPRERERDADFAVVGRAGVVVGHLEEDEVGELFELVAVADAVVTERGAEAPDFGDDGIGGHMLEAGSFLESFELPVFSAFYLCERRNQASRCGADSAFYAVFQSSPGMMRFINSSNSGTVNAVSPWLGLQIIPFVIS